MAETNGLSVRERQFPKCTAEPPQGSAVSCSPVHVQLATRLETSQAEEPPKADQRVTVAPVGTNAI